MPPARACDAICFDAGNTLVYLDHDQLSGVLAEYGVRIKPEKLARSELETRVEFDRADLVGSTSDAERWHAYLESMLAKAGLRAGPAFGRLVEAVKEINRRRRLWSRVPPKVPRLLARLRAAGFRLAVVSNSDGRVRQFLEDADLARHFEVIVDSFEVGVEKPDPRIFDYALKPLGVPPERAMHVGDYYHIDVVGAERAGIRGVLLDPLGLQRRRPCAVVRKLEEIERLVDIRPAKSQLPTPNSQRGSESGDGGDTTSKADSKVNSNSKSNSKSNANSNGRADSRAGRRGQSG